MCRDMVIETDEQYKAVVARLAELVRNGRRRTADEARLMRLLAVLRYAGCLHLAECRAGTRASSKRTLPQPAASLHLWDFDAALGRRWTPSAS